MSDSLLSPHHNHSDVGEDADLESPSSTSTSKHPDHHDKSLSDPVSTSEPSSASSDDLLTRSVVRVVDHRILPFLCFLYFLNYLDRANLANVKHDISESLDLSDSQYALASSIFQIGYILCEIPANLVLKHSRASRWLGFLAIVFGMVAVTTIWCRNYTDLICVRFFLGVAEAGFAPGVLFYLCYWYTPAELASRNAVFLLAAPLSNTFGAVIAYGFLQLDGLTSLSGWQWLFLLEGAAPIILGIITINYLPDQPSTCKWLDDEQKAHAIQRIPMLNAHNNNHHTDKHVTKSTDTEDVIVADAGRAPCERLHVALRSVPWLSIFSVMTNPAIISFALLNFCTNVASYGLGAFLPAIMESLGFDSIYANLTTAPLYLFQAIVTITMATCSDRWKERGVVMFVCLLVAALGMGSLAAAITLDAPFGLQYALCFTLVFYAPCSPIMLAWCRQCYSSPVEASLGPAFVLTIGSLGGFLGPNLYGTTSDDSASSYVTGHFIMAGVFTLAAIIVLLQKIHLKADEHGVVSWRWGWRWRACRDYCCCCCRGGNSLESLPLMPADHAPPPSTHTDAHAK